jgi:DnaJ domain
MPAYIALGVLLLLAILATGHVYVKASPRTLAQLIKAVGLVLAGLVFLLAVVSGRGAALIGLAPIVFFAVMAFKQASRRKAASGGPSRGASSAVTTRYFRMSLDHDTGTVSGEVTAGRFAGRNLSDLSVEDLLDLRRDCADDAQSVSVLEAYLDRVHPDWRTHGSGAQGGAQSGTGVMTLEEARAILGVGPDATGDEIREAHRRLMQKLHPDRGGSTYLAAQINRARDLLLRH